MVILNKYKNIGALHVEACTITAVSFCHDIDNDEGEVIDVKDELLARDN